MNGAVGVTPTGQPAATGDGGDAPVFREPWEAQAFAMVLSLHAGGLFTWPEWAATLAGEIAADQGTEAPDADGGRYYHHWLRALERLVDEKGAGSAAEIERYRKAWQGAAARTPHGAPIELRSADLAP